MLMALVVLEVLTVLLVLLSLSAGNCLHLLLMVLMVLAVIAGTLIEEPQLRRTKGGTAVSTVTFQITREWEKDGQKRTAWQIVADAIGPDLRFAQVQVEKVQRDKPQARPSDPIFGDESEF
jgi:single-stranded DNA-binding protein